MSIITKQLSLTDFQWAYLRNLVRDFDDQDMSLHWSIIRAIESAELISETVTTADTWADEMLREGKDVR